MKALIKRTNTLRSRLFPFVMLSIALPLHKALAGDVNITNPLTNPDGGSSTLQDVINRVIAWILGIAGSLAILMIIAGGFQYITAGGNKDKAEQAKNYIRYAITGVIVILIAYVIVQTINVALTGSPYTP